MNCQGFLSLFLCFLIACSPSDQAPEIPEITPEKVYPLQVQFPSLDSLTITANLYETGKENPAIVLCHQANYNKFEYAGIAEVLNEKGFNCLAIDQRYGGPIANQQNETALEASKKGLQTDFLSAEQDIIAAINFAHKRYNQPVILWGNSYSATLALYIGAENENVNAVLSFSLGDFFSHEKGSFKILLASFEKPFFITSSRKESQEILTLLEGIELKENQIHHIPQKYGHHGSKALWPNQRESEDYWDSVNKFLTHLAN